MNAVPKRTPAQRQADKTYEQKTSQVIMRFRKDDKDDRARLSWLNQKGNKTATIKHLIDEAMMKNP